MATDCTMTSPWNKMAGHQLSLLLQVTWILCTAVSACGLPRQGSQAATILSGRPAQPIGLLPRSSTERCPVHMLCAGLHPDAPGQVRLTGLSTLRLYTAWRIRWAHHLSGSMLPSRLHPLLASGACSYSNTTTQSLLWTVSARFKLQPLAKYMYSLERQSTTFLPPLSVTPANPYDFPQKSLAQENPTGICSLKLRSLSGPWRVTSIWTPWTDPGVNAICPGLLSQWPLLHRETRWNTSDLQCWKARLNAWLSPVEKRNTFQSSPVCSPDWSVLTASMQGSEPGYPLLAMPPSACTPRSSPCPMSARLGTQCVVLPADTTCIRLAFQVLLQQLLLSSCLSPV